MGNNGKGGGGPGMRMGAQVRDMLRVNRQLGGSREMGRTAVADALSRYHRRFSNEADSVTDFASRARSMIAAGDMDGARGELFGAMITMRGAVTEQLPRGAGGPTPASLMARMDPKLDGFYRSMQAVMRPTGRARIAGGMPSYRPQDLRRALRLAEQFGRRAQRDVKTMRALIDRTRV